MDEISTKLLASKYPALAEKFAGDLLAVENFRDDWALTVDKSAIRSLIQFSKQDPTLRFEMMTDLFGMDYLKYQPTTPERYAVVYILYSFLHKDHLRLKVYLAEPNPEIESIHDLYHAANWFEREAWDLYGIVFKNHPNLVRILCHQDFVGHPLRKDYPSDKYQRLKTPAPSTGF